MENNENKPQGTSLEVFQTIAEKVSLNAPVIAEKVSRASAALSAITKVETAEDDQAANAVLVKCNATLGTIEKMRKDYTGPINDWLKTQIAPENTLKKNMERVKLLRDQKANADKAKADEEAKEIEMERAKKVHEIEVKQRMKAGVESGVTRKLMKFRSAIQEQFDKMTPANYHAFSKWITIKPTMKEEAFLSFLDVDYDKNIMTNEEFQDLKQRAAVHFDYKKANGEYLRLGLEVIESFRKRIMPRVKELEKIAEGDELLKKQTEARDRDEAEKRKVTEAEELQAIADNAIDSTQKEVLQAEFDAQVKTQDVANTVAPGSRTKTTLRIAPEVEKNMLKLSQLIAKIVLCDLSNPKTKGIFSRDAQGFPKHDAQGRALYVDGVQYWLDQLEATGFSGMIEGIIKTEEVKTIARK